MCKHLHDRDKHLVKFVSLCLSVCLFIFLCLLFLCLFCLCSSFVSHLVAFFIIITIRYLGSKVYEYHQCLFCNSYFKSLIAVRSHMISKGHTNVSTEKEEQEDEIIEFYDYSSSYKDVRNKREFKKKNYKENLIKQIRICFLLL